MITAGILFLIVLALFGLPLFAVIGGITLLLFHSIGQEIGLTMGDTYRIAITPGLVALPLFVFTGYLLAETRISSRIIRLFQAFMGWLPGGVAMASLISMAIFTAFTGISIVTIVAFGGILLPMLKKNGFSENFSVGFITSTGLVGALLPPCIVVILYGLIAQVNIRGLYIAGILPVVFCVLILYAYIAFYSFKNKLPRQSFAFREMGAAIWDSKWEAPWAAFILTGIFGGLFNVSDAAALTFIYFLVVEMFILKEVRLSQLPRIMRESLIMLGAIFFILGMALSFANYLIYQQIPMQLLDMVQESISSKITFLLILNLFLLVVGMIIDMFSAIVVIVPMILPIADHYGVNPYHLAIIFLINLQIGNLTPPVGINLFIASMRFNRSIVAIIRSIIPFLLLLLAGLTVITFWPELSTRLIELFNVQDQLLV